MHHQLGHPLRQPVQQGQQAREEVRRALYHHASEMCHTDIVAGVGGGRNAPGRANAQLLDGRAGPKSPTPEWLDRDSDRLDPRLPCSRQHRPPNPWKDVHVLMAVDVGDGDSCRPHTLELRGAFHGDLLGSHQARECTAYESRQRIEGLRPRIDQRRDVLPGSDRTADGQIEVQPDAQVRSLGQPGDCVAEPGSVDEQRGGRYAADSVGFEDPLVDSGRQAEVVGDYRKTALSDTGLACGSTESAPDPAACRSHRA